MEHNIIWGIVGAALIGSYAWYASIVSKNNKVQEALSGIDVQLQQRSDLLPNLLAIAKRFLAQESNVLIKVTELRAAANKPYDRGNPTEVQQHLGAADALGRQMGGIMVQMEQYPELKSDSLMLQTQQSFNEVEAQLAASRRFYNAAVNALNTAIQIFPGNIFAKFAGAQKMPSFAAEANARGPVDAAALLNG